MSCKICGNKILEEENIVISKGKRVIKPKFRNYLTIKYLEGVEIPIVCYECFKDKFGPLKRGLSKEQFRFTFGLSEEQIKEKFNNFGVTLEKLKKAYGEEDGVKRFKEYCDKQAKSNSLEYKKEKYGWTEEDFKEYNKSRSVTLENCIKRHGIDEGTRIFKEYCKKQSYSGCKLEYFIEKLGKEEGTIRYFELNKDKGQTLSNFKKRYGEEDGEKEYLKYLNRTKNFSSKEADKFFKLLLDKIYFEKIYTNALNGFEYKIIEKGSNKVYFYDFVVLDTMKIIEFNGSIFHANPKLFAESDTPNPYNKKLIAKEIWESDKVKREVAERRGFNVLYIWDCDVIENLELEIERCINFLKEKE